MKITCGFDLDGVLSKPCEKELTTIKPNSFEEIEYYIKRKQHINVKFNFIVITGRPRRLRPVTEAWFINNFKYCPKIYFVGCASKEGKLLKYFGQKWAEEKYAKIQSKAKAKIINKLNLLFYWEDNFKIVKILRKLCPKTSIIWINNHYNSKK